MSRSRHPKGNVLLSAIFMSVILFFLCVALVSQNRVDISLSLSVDHKARADAAARSGLEVALSHMRRQGNWRNAWLEPDQELSSGATYTTRVEQLPSPDGSPFLLKVVAEGHSGLLKSTRWAVVEEVSLLGAAAEPPNELSPYLFTVAVNGQLAALGPDFRWHEVGNHPRPEACLAAYDGPLFTFAPEGTATVPPSIVDRIPLFLQGEEGLELIPGPVTRIELVPPGEHLLTLDLEKGEWVDIPDPGPQLGKKGEGLVEVTEEMKDWPVIRIWQEPEAAEDGPPRPPWDQRQVSLSGERRSDGGFDILTLDMNTGTWDDVSLDWETITLDWNEITADWEDITLDWETITQPRIFLEWYSLDGEALWADGDTVTCHATHYFYGHTNTEDGPNWPELGRPAYDIIIYKRPAVLRYSLKEKEWEILADYMTVDNPESEPRLVRTPTVTKKAIAVKSDDQVLAFTQEGKSSPQLHTLSGKRITSAGRWPAGDDQLIFYEDKPHYFAKSVSPVDGSERWVLSGLDGEILDPNGGLGEVVPALTADMPEELEEQSLIRPSYSVELGLTGFSHAYGLSSGGRLLLAGFLDRKSQVEDEAQPVHSLPPRRILTLFAYDGEYWQVLPGGKRDLFLTDPEPAESTRLEVESPAGTSLELLLHKLALARYPAEIGPTSRYTVLASGSGTGPTPEEE